MRLYLLSLILLTLAGCVPISSNERTPEDISYPDLGPARELTSNTWLNTDNILRLADLRGKVVLIDMWTFG